MNSKSNLTKEEQKLYNEIMPLFDASLKKVIEKEKKDEQEAIKNEKIHDEIQRKKYLESLKPISMDEFITEVKILHERYKKFLEFRQKENILTCSMDLDFNNIINQARIANNGLELAEIIDKAKGTMHDLEEIKNIVAGTNKIIEEELEKQR